MSYTLSYDNGAGAGTAHNITGFESAGVTVSNIYDTKGNMLSTTTTGTGALPLISTSMYTADNHISQQEDVNGIGYSANYDRV